MPDADIGRCDDCGSEEGTRSTAARTITVGGISERVVVWLCPACLEAHYAPAGSLRPLNRNLALNRIAAVVEEVLGVPVDGSPGAQERGPWLPLSVRYAAAEAAMKVATDWIEAHP